MFFVVYRVAPCILACSQLLLFICSSPAFVFVLMLCDCVQSYYGNFVEAGKAVLDTEYFQFDLAFCDNVTASGLDVIVKVRHLRAHVFLYPEPLRSQEF